MRAELVEAPFDRLRAQGPSANPLSGCRGEMLMHSEPAAIALASEDDRLALMQCLGPRAGHHVSDDVVNENRRVAEHLNTNTGGEAVGDPEVVLADPSVPQPPIGVNGLQSFGSGVEDEGRVIGETGEIVIEPTGTERGNQPLGRRSDLRFVVAHDSLLFTAGGLNIIMAVR